MPLVSLPLAMLVTSIVGVVCSALIIMLMAAMLRPTGLKAVSRLPYLMPSQIELRLGESLILRVETLYGSLPWAACLAVAS